MINEIPAEIIREIYSFVGIKCNCCLKDFKHFNEIKHMFKYTIHYPKPKIYYYCSDECLMFLP